MEKFYDITHKTADEYGTHEALWNEIKAKGFKGFSCEVPVTFEKAEGSDLYTMVFSTADEDRHGDIVMQNFDLKFYKKNPVILDSHNYHSISHIIGKAKNIRIEDGKLKGEIEFAEMNPMGVLAKEMVAGGFINASSIGFIPKEFDDKGTILKSELLENSLVSVPANARALFEKVATEAKAEIETLEKEIEEKEEVTVEEVIETKTVIDKKKIVLNQIAKALKEMEKKNIEEKRRVIFKALRSL